jgi:hypothetical protein
MRGWSSLKHLPCGLTNLENLFSSPHLSCLTAHPSSLFSLFNPFDHPAIKTSYLIALHTYLQTFRPNKLLPKPPSQFDQATNQNSRKSQATKGQRRPACVASSLALVRGTQMGNTSSGGDSTKESVTTPLPHHLRGCVMPPDWLKHLSQLAAVERDLYTAIAWYEKAARQGHAKAMCTLGWCYSKVRPHIFPPFSSILPTSSSSSSSSSPSSSLPSSHHKYHHHQPPPLPPPPPLHHHYHHHMIIIIIIINLLFFTHQYLLQGMR